MTRLETLQIMYMNIGGADVPMIKTFQKLYKIEINPPHEEIMIIVDELADDDFKFDKLEELKNYELSLQNEFDITFSQIEANISANGHLGSLKRLQKTLADIFEAIKHSYITLKGEYKEYEDRYILLNEEIEDQKVVKGRI